MTCYNKQPITIYKGFGTRWEEQDLLKVTFNSEVNIDGFGAEFYIGNIKKTYQNIQGGFGINLTAQETATLTLGPNTGSLVIIDTENNKRPFSTELPFIVKDWADGDIKLDGFDLTIDAKIQDNILTINIESARAGYVEPIIDRKISDHNLSEQAHPYIQGLISSEEEARITADGVLQDNIDAEETRAKGAEDDLNDKIEAETTRAEGAEGTLQNNINAEETARKTADKTLQDNIDIVSASIKDGTLTIQKNGTTVQTFSANQSSNVTANLIIPTKTSEITNDSDFATNSGVSTAISNHNTSEEAHSYIQGLISSEENRAKGVEGSLTSLTTDTKTNLVSAINEVDSHTDTNTSNIGTLSNLTTEVKTNLVDAINEVDSHADTNANNIGVLTSLTTNAKTNLVSAINEVDSHTDTNTSNIGTMSSLTTDIKTTLVDAINEVDSHTDTNTNNIGTLTSLTTTDKTNLVSAINEVNGAISSEVTRAKGVEGTLTNLSTDSKTNLVSAINEVDSHTDTNTSNIGTLTSLTTDAQSNLVSAINEVDSHADINASSIGTLTRLTTDAKTNLVSAINEIDGHTDKNASDISDINSLIPEQASSTNQLADKSFVNSSISTNTAYFIGTFNSIEELKAYSGTLTNNDYAFVIGKDTVGNVEYNRYKYNGSEWLYEYTLNNSSFTADQWSAINSGITSAGVAQITTNKNDIDELGDQVSGIEEKIPANASASNQLATKSDITSSESSIKGYVDGKEQSIRNDFASADTGLQNQINALSQATTTNQQQINTINSKIPKTASTSNLLATTQDLNSLSTNLNGEIDNVRKDFASADTGLQTQITNLSNVVDEEKGKITAIEGKIPTNASTSNLLTTTQDLNGLSTSVDNKIADVRNDFASADTGLQNQINTVNGTISDMQDDIASNMGEIADLKAKKLASGLSYSNDQLQLKDQDGNALGNSVTIKASANFDNKSITKNTNDELQTVGVIDQNDTVNAIKTWSGTRAEFDAIATKDPNTIYNVEDDFHKEGVIGFGRNVGDIFYTTRTDSELNGAVECNGATYSVFDFTGEQAIGNLLGLNKLSYVSLAEYANIVSTNGSCRAFGWDGGDSFRVPTIPALLLTKEQAGVIGNGMTLGLTDGANLGGLNNSTGSANNYVFMKEQYGVSVGNVASSATALSPTDRKAIGVITDPTKSGIVANLDTVRYRAMVQLANDATDDALITATSALQQIANKVNTDASNFTADGKETIVGLGMPDYSAGIFKTTSGWSAPSNGWVYWRSGSSGGTVYCNGVLVTNSGRYTDQPTQFFPVSKNDTITFTSQEGVVFYPCKGVN